jgi:Flp pilus assembly CpaE family ATPase
MRRIWSVLLPLALAACDNPAALRDELVLQVQPSQVGDDGEVVLFISSYPGEGAGTGAAALAYEISIPLSPGTRDVRVSHFDQRAGSGNSRTVAAGQVTVTRD